MSLNSIATMYPKLVGEYSIVYSVILNSELFKVFMVFHPAVDEIRYWYTNGIYSNLLAFNIINSKLKMHS